MALNAKFVYKMIIVIFRWFYYHVRMIWQRLMS